MEKVALPRQNATAPVSFIDALETLLNVQDIEPTDIKWAGIEKDSVALDIPPIMSIEPGIDHPHLAIALFPKGENEHLLPLLPVYYAPLLVNDVQRWGTASKTLGKYELTGLMGAAEEKSMFSTPQTLKGIIDMLLTDDITDTTAVVEAVALLPLVPECATEFAPEIRFKEGHRYYKVSLVFQDKLNIYAPLTDGKRSLIQNIQQDKSLHLLKPEFVPELDDLEQLMLPSSRGHMIVIAVPYEKPSSFFDFGKSLDDWKKGNSLGDNFRLGYSRSGYSETRGFSGSCFMSKGVTVGEVSIGQGSKTGKGSVYTGTLEQSSKGHPVIYHIRFLGVKPDQVANLTAEKLNGLGAALSNYRA